MHTPYKELVISPAKRSFHAAHLWVVPVYPQGSASCLTGASEVVLASQASESISLTIVSLYVPGGAAEQQQQKHLVLFECGSAAAVASATISLRFVNPGCGVPHHALQGV